jgi:hypothetical protein
LTLAGLSQKKHFSAKKISGVLFAFPSGCPTPENPDRKFFDFTGVFKNPGRGQGKIHKETHKKDFPKN